jgi:hypothetical protein
VNGGYGVFLGSDVGKGDHHAVGLAPDGRRLHDAPLPNTEAICGSYSTNSAVTGWCWWSSTSLPRSAPCRSRWHGRAGIRWPTCPAWPCGASPICTPATRRPTPVTPMSSPTLPAPCPTHCGRSTLATRHVPDVVLAGSHQVGNVRGRLPLGGHQHHDRLAQLHRVLRGPGNPLQPLTLGHRYLPDEHLRPSTHRPSPPTALRVGRQPARHILRTDGLHDQRSKTRH